MGFDWFIRLFRAPTFARMMKNTIAVSVFGLLWSFPVPIILSLIINQVRFPRYKRLVQTVLYAPRFISVMVICGMIRIFLSPTGGWMNDPNGWSMYQGEYHLFYQYHPYSNEWAPCTGGT